MLLNQTLYRHVRELALLLLLRAHLADGACAIARSGTLQQQGLADQRVILCDHIDWPSNLRRALSDLLFLHFKVCTSVNAWHALGGEANALSCLVLFRHRR
jgi:hypothetical protein